MDYIEGEGFVHDAKLMAECRAIAARLRSDSPVPELDTLTQIADRRSQTRGILKSLPEPRAMTSTATSP
jgi:hypothetical protein